MREWRALKVTFHTDQAYFFGYAAGVRIQKTDVLIGGNLLGHFRSQLQVKGKIDLFGLWEFVFIRIWRGQSKFYDQCTQDMPCDPVIFPVRVSIADYKEFFQV